MTLDQYLKAEFRRYFLDADLVFVETADETITVVIYWSDNYLEYIMEIGSDDNMFSFFNDELQSTITVPLMSED